jgi:hypothetical protein
MQQEAAKRIEICLLTSSDDRRFHTKIVCRFFIVTDAECEPPTVRLIGNRQRVERRSRKMRFEVFVPLRCPMHQLVHDWKVRSGQCRQPQYVGEDEDELVSFV